MRNVGRLFRKTKCPFRSEVIEVFERGGLEMITNRWRGAVIVEVKYEYAESSQKDLVFSEVK